MTETATGNCPYSLTFEISGKYDRSFINKALVDVMSEKGDDARVEGNGDGYRITFGSHSPCRDLEGMKVDFLERIECGLEQ